MTRLSVQGVTKSYLRSSRDKPSPILSGVSLDVTEGEICALLGPSGCGKSTLLRVIVGTESEDSGTILLEPFNPLEVGVVFQHDNCLPWLRVRENVEFGINKAYRLKDERRRISEEALGRVGLLSQSEGYPGSMSGGEQQRVAFARLLASGKSVWLLDEPFSALDAKTRNRMRSLLREKAQVDKVSALLVTHDLVEAVDLADRIYVMSAVPSVISCTLDRVADLRANASLVLETHRFLSEIIGDREPIIPEGQLATYVTTRARNA